MAAGRVHAAGVPDREDPYPVAVGRREPVVRRSADELFYQDVSSCVDRFGKTALNLSTSVRPRIGPAAASRTSLTSTDAFTDRFAGAAQPPPPGAAA
jgi:hypothetical protein